MKKNIVILATTSLVAMTGLSQAVTVAQTNFNARSGGANFGQEVRLNSSQAAFSSATSFALTSFTLYKGDGGGGSATLFMDVYMADATTGSAETTPDFSVPTTAGLTYLGSSTNSFDYSNAGAGSDGTTLGPALTWTFTGIDLLVDRDIYFVSSNNNTAGNFQGASYNIQNTTPLAFTNITNDDSDVMFGGPGDAETTQDNRYDLVVVPEPSALGLGLLGTAGLLLRRRR